jgi:hypothetical protein
MKRWHHKSRNGCLQCRRRRIKCDEGRPSCRNCIRAEAAAECVYRQNANPSPIHPPPTVVGPSSPHVSAPPGAPVPLTHRDLELMHHYCTSTSATLVEDAEISTWMRDVAPTLLLPHPNLIGSLLGLTAAHMAHQRSFDKQPYVSLAYSHLNYALAQSQHSLENLSTSTFTAEYGAALCLTAICTSLTIQAMPVVDSNQQHMSPVQRFITNFRAFRGISVVFWACSIHGSGFDQTFLPPDGRDTLPTLDDDALRTMDDIWLLIRLHGQQCQTPNDQRLHAMYGAVFEELKNYSRATTLRQIATVITTTTPAQWNLFCRLLEDGDVVCSLVGLYYAGAFAHVGARWFLGGLHSRVVDVLAARVAHLGELEARIAAWARQRVGGSDAASIGGSLPSRNTSVSMIPGASAAGLRTPGGAVDAKLMPPTMGEDMAARAAQLVVRYTGEQFRIRNSFDLNTYLPMQGQ